MCHNRVFVLFIREVALLRVPEVCSDVVCECAGLNIQNLFHLPNTR